MASDKTVLLALAQTLTNKTLTSPVINTGVSGTAILDEDDMATDSNTQLSTQQSIKAYIDSGTVTMTNKTLTSPVINTGISGTALKDEDDMSSDSASCVASQQSIKAYVDSGTVTMTNKTLTSPVINTGVSGTAFKDEDNMSSDSAACVASQQSIRAYSPVEGYYYNLVITNNATNPTYQIDVDANAVALEDTSNDFIIVRDVNLTIDISASEANGLDTGSEAASTWYSIWVIYNGSTISGLLSISATSPTLPSGYTYKRRVGWVRNDAGSDFFSIYQENERVVYQVINNAEAIVLTAGAATSYTDVDCSAAIPSTSRLGWFNYLASASDSLNLYIQVNGHAQESVRTLAYVTAVASENGDCHIPLDSSQIFEYAWSAANGTVTIYALGYYDKL